MRLLISLVSTAVLTATLYARPQTSPTPTTPPAETTEAARTIAAPSRGLPAESETRRLRKVSFIVYGDTRGGPTDGVTVHPVHSQLIERMLAVIRSRANSDRAVRFVVQTGDAVLRGSDGRMWNVSFIPIIERLTRGAGIPYFFTLGNHDVLPARPPGTADGRENALRAMRDLLPPVGSERRYGDSVTYAFGVGHVFMFSFDSNIPDDPGQLGWVSAQLEALDRKRYPIVVAFMHHAPYSSGLHGVPAGVEPQTLGVRAAWMPLFRQHHVRLVLAGHEHHFEHWVERYRRHGRSYRMDIVISGGGGAPVYGYRGEPDLSGYLRSGAGDGVRVEHLARPSPGAADNPSHFVVLDIDGDRIDEEVVSIGDVPLEPFDGRSRLRLRD